MGRRFETITAGTNDDGRRIDTVLRRVLSRLPLSRIYRALRAGEIRMDGARAKPGARVRAGAVIEVAARLLDQGSGEVESPSADPGPVQAMIVARTGHLLVLNKPKGIPVQGGSNLGTRPLDEMVRAYLAGSGASLSFRPGPLHRLDRNTSGLVVFSVSIEGARRFSAAIRDGRLRKYYLALLGGRLTGTEVWRDPLVRDPVRRLTRVSNASGKAVREAETRVTPLLAGREATLALCRLVTGRAHQIRAHAAAHGLPLYGDRKYGGTGDGGYLLHALRLELEDPDPLLGSLRYSAPLDAGQQSRVAALLGLPVSGRHGRTPSSVLSLPAIEAAVGRLDTP